MGDIRVSNIHSLRRCFNDSGKTVVVGHTPQTDGRMLDLGFLKCLDTACHSGGWLTALDVDSGHIWQASQRGDLR